MRLFKFRLFKFYAFLISFSFSTAQQRDERKIHVMRYYMIYKFGGLSSEEVLRARKELFEKYGDEDWFIFDRDVGGERFGGDKAAIALYCKDLISTLPLTTIVVVDVRNGVGRLGWEEIRAAEARGLSIETFGGPLPSERKYL